MTTATNNSINDVEEESDFIPVFPWYEIGDWISHKMGLCVPKSWSTRLADKFFIECYCCFFLRGVSLGFWTGTAMTAAIFMAYSLVPWGTL